MKENHCLQEFFAVLCHCPKGTDASVRGHQGCGVPETAHNKSLIINQNYGNNQQS